jgi:lactate dehydrogenase-like 2-hydroxyacid dehydrogenase
MLTTPLQLASVGLDVYPDEPRVNPTLLAMDNVTLLPHVGTETSDTQRKVSSVYEYSARTASNVTVQYASSDTAPRWNSSFWTT